MTHNHTTSFPFILEVTASVSSRTLIYAENLDEAERLLEERIPELMEHIRAEAHLPDNEHVLYDFDARGAWGFEVAGSEALLPGLPAIDKCDHEGHSHGHMELGITDEEE